MLRVIVNHSDAQYNDDSEYSRQASAVRLLGWWRSY